MIDDYCYVHLLHNTEKEQFAILGIKTQFGGVLFETEIDKEHFKQVKIGTPFKLTLLKDDRNYKHHRKFFKLLSIAYEYWQPDYETISESEKWVAKRTAAKCAEVLNQYLHNSELKAAIQNAFTQIEQDTLDLLGKNREEKLDYEGMKTFEGFLDHIMKKADCYDLVPDSDGGTHKQRWSLSFDAMPQSIFNDVYKRCFGVIWNEMLSDVFATPQDLENRVAMLLEFD